MRRKRRLWKSVGRRPLTLLCVAALLMGLCAPPASAAGTIIGSKRVITGYDIVLLIDASASMRLVDDRSSAKNAASMFLDSLYIPDADSDAENRTGVPKSSVGIIFYNDVVRRRTQQMVPINSTASIAALQKVIYDTDYSATAGDSALGDALYDAARMLASGGEDNTHEKIILLFTDGYAGSASGNDSGAARSDDPLMPYLGGSVQNSLQSAMEYARDLQCRVFVLGLDYNNNMGSSWEELRKIANYTQLRLDKAGTPPPPVDGAETAPMPTDEWTLVDGVFQRESDGMSGALESEYYRQLIGTTDAGTVNITQEVNAGKCDYFKAHSVVDVQTFYVDLNCNMLTGSEPKSIQGEFPDDWCRYEAKVETPGNSAIIFYILSNSRIESIQLESQLSGQTGGGRTEAPPDDASSAQPDASGQPPTQSYRLNNVDKYGWTKDGKVRLRWWQGYTTLTVVDPDPGAWIVKVLGINQQVRYTVVGGMTLDFKAERMGDSAVAHVTAQILYRGAPMDAAFYQSLPADAFSCKATFQGDKAGMAGIQAMPANPGGEGAAPPPEPGAEGGPSGGNVPDAPPDGENAPTAPQGGTVDVSAVPRLDIPLAYDPQANALTGDLTVTHAGHWRFRCFFNASGVAYDKRDFLDFTDAKIPVNPVPVPNRDNRDFPILPIALTLAVLLLLILILRVIRNLRIRNAGKLGLFLEMGEYRLDGWLAVPDKGKAFSLLELTERVFRQKRGDPNLREFRQAAREAKYALSEHRIVPGVSDSGVPTYFIDDGDTQDLEVETLAFSDRDNGLTIYAQYIPPIAE